LTIKTKDPFALGGKVSEITERIEKLRKMKNSSQEDIARMLCINRATYSRIERGHSKLTVDYVIKISKYFGVSVQWLITGKEVKTPKDEIDIDFSNFGEYQDTVKLMLKDMLENKELMHSIFADFFLKKALKDIKKRKEL
jgi:transcriptional regulator with XRE-family HTH domain